MRASHVHANLRSLELMGQDQAQRVRDAVDPDVLRAIESATRVAWLPVELDLELSEAVDRILGPQALTDWSRLAMQDSFRGPLLGPVVDGAVRLFGLHPGRLAKVFPRGWTQIYRGCGDLKTEPSGGDSVRISHVAPPELLRVSDVFHRSVAGAFSALFDVARVRGEVSVVVLARHVDYTLNWR